MDTIIESIAKILPFQLLGLDKTTGELLSLITLSVLVFVCRWMYKYFVKKYLYHKSTFINMMPQFDFISIENARKYFIPTHYQNASPTKEDEPGFTHQFFARNKLIPFFNEYVFQTKAIQERFYLVLGDSGMGKTTFMINLYFSYHSIFNFKRKYDMKILRFSNNDTITRIQSITNKVAANTILLLDALDEDKNLYSQNINVSAEQAFKNRVDEIIEITKNFKIIIITCRTQYFPHQEDHPFELKIQRPDEKGFYILNKLYISPFTEKEVNQFLKKKYGYLPFINSKKKILAKEIVSKSQNLVMRPMLLSYIDLLIDIDTESPNSFEIYKKLVQEWLVRESEKRKYLRDRDIFIEHMYKLSKAIAVTLYSNWISEGRMFVSKNEALKLAIKYEIQLSSYEVTGQSLLTCDGLDNWKFSHKSILEFFLANEIHDNPSLLRENTFQNMGLVLRFYSEHPDRLILIPENGLSWFQKKYRMYYSYRVVYPNDLLKLNVPIFVSSLKNNFYNVSQVIQYCNALNISKGYKPTYDANCRLINESGQITNNFISARGFRLPTAEEFAMVHLNKHSNDGILSLIYPQYNRSKINYMWSTGATGEIRIQRVKDDFDVLLQRLHFNTKDHDVLSSIVNKDSKQTALFYLVFQP